MASYAAVEALTERLRLAEVEIIGLKSMEAPNLATMQALVGTIDVRLEEQMEHVWRICKD